jgi:hypothetical protein
VDLAAILPYFIELILYMAGVNANAQWVAVLRILLLARIFLIFKVGRMVIEVRVRKFFQ